MPLTRAQRQGKRYVNPVPTKVGGLSLMFKVGPRILIWRSGSHAEPHARAVSY